MHLLNLGMAKRLKTMMVIDLKLISFVLWECKYMSSCSLNIIRLKHQNVKWTDRTQNAFLLSLINWSIHLSVSTLINPSICQSVNQSPNQSINQSVSQSIISSINQSINQSINLSIGLSHFHYRAHWSGV